MERLTKLYNGQDKDFEGRYICNYNKNCNDSCLYNACKWREEATQKLAEYENAEGQGLLVRLPIAIGNVVWEIIKTYQKDYSTRETKKSVKIEPKYVLGFEVLPCEKYIVIDNPHYDEKKNLDELGKTIFLTEDEALQALKERE